MTGDRNKSAKGLVIDPDEKPLRPRKVVRADEVLPGVGEILPTDRTMLSCIDPAFHAHSPGRYRGRLTTAG